MAFGFISNNLGTLDQVRLYELPRIGRGALGNAPAHATEEIDSSVERIEEFLYVARLLVKVKVDNIHEHVIFNLIDLRVFIVNSDFLIIDRLVIVGNLRVDSNVVF